MKKVFKRKVHGLGGMSLRLVKEQAKKVSTLWNHDLMGDYRQRDAIVFKCRCPFAATKGSRSKQEKEAAQIC